MKKILLLILLLFTMVGLASCNEEVTTEQPEIVDITNVSFKSVTHTYDGNPVSIYVTNLPEGLTVEYVGNGVVEVGSYEVKAIIKDSKGNKVATIFANIIINPAVDLSLVKFEGTEYVYDGESVSIYVTNLPDGVTVEYAGNGVSEIGTHEVTATIKDKDGKVLLNLKANIVIVKPSDVELPLV
jgi:hypothetical protein